MAIFFYKDPAIEKAGYVALRQLYSFIDAESPALVRFLHSTWREQEKVVTYKQLREAILSGDITSDMVKSWQQSYSRFVTEYMFPAWEKSFEAASVELKDRYPSFAFDGTAEGVRRWNMDNAARFVTNTTTEQIKGLRAVIRRATDLAEAGMNVDELSRVIRPMVGLTDRQTRANLNYYQKLIDNGMSKEKARDKAIRYSARQHRYRAQMIARTELAFSYNQGQYLAVKQAQEQNLMGKCRKVWVTADTERTCMSCNALDGKEIEMDEDFDIQTNLKGSLIRRCPPAHPHCMCAINYIEYEPPTVNGQTDTPQQQPTPDNPTGIDDPDNPYFLTPATNIKQANEDAMDILGIPNANYKGTTVEIANEWNRGLAETFNRFPELKANFDFVGTCQNRNKHAKKELYSVVMEKYKKVNPMRTEKELEKAVKRHIARNYAPAISAETWAQSVTNIKKIRGITISDKHFGERFQASLKNNVAIKFHPEGCDTVKSILDHEIGHQLDDLLGISESDTIQRMYYGFKNNAEITNELSRYAWDNSSRQPIREFVAEAWAEYMNNPTPRRVSKTVGEFIESEYKKFAARQ